MVIDSKLRDLAGAVPQRRLPYPGQSGPAEMGQAAGTVGVQRVGCMGLGDRNRILPIGPSRACAKGLREAVAWAFAGHSGF
jgi:hypothetical protein